VTTTKTASPAAAPAKPAGLYSSSIYISLTHTHTHTPSLSLSLSLSHTHTHTQTHTFYAASSCRSITLAVASHTAIKSMCRIVLK
jgi:hypothetical protein